MNILNGIIFFDNKIESIVLNLRNSALDTFFLFFTNLGSWQAIVVISLIGAIFFYFKNKRDLILPLFVAISSSGLITVIVKYFTGRSRPEVALYTEKLSSFPSAHAALILATFGFLIYCLWRFDLKPFRRVLLALVFSVIIILIGFSRLYLGVHFFSDVIFGYLIGLICILFGFFIHKKL